MESAGGPIRGALERLRSAPLWVWITILLTFGLLVFAYLQYRKNQANSNTSTTSTSAGLGTVPGDGTGQPLWNTADTSGFVAGNVTDLAALLAYLQSQQTPNAPTTATPTPIPTTGKTQVTIQNFPKGATINQVLAANPGLSLAWLQAWNKQANPQWFSHPWWQFSGPTQLNIPHAAFQQPAASA